MIRLIVIAITAVLTACSTSKPEATATEPVAVVPVVSKKQPVAPRPKARIYKTTGDYRNNVPVTVVDGKVVSFPAVSDINPAMLPIVLADNYLLDRRGISVNTVFTSFTYEAYSSLPATPSVNELKAAIITGAVVTEIIELPFDTPTAVGDTARCNDLIRSGLPGCKVIQR